MKTLEQIKGYKTKAMDGRDLHRLFVFIPEDQLKDFGLELKDKYFGTHKELPLTKENVLERLKSDLAFAFEKALEQRGISSSFMFQVIRMWNWILEEGLDDWPDDNYAMYGLPLYKATALKYGFDNPIGDDIGNEDKYGDY